MAVPLKNIQIENFKSLRSCKIKGLKRINLFIGKPNVGKSNILEALSIFTLPSLAESKARSLNSLVRVENETELFYQGNFEQPATIATDQCTARLSYERQTGLTILIDMPGIFQNFNVDEHLQVRFSRKTPESSFIKKYAYSSETTFVRGHARYLTPPNGSNLLTVIEQNESLKKELSSWFEDYGLSLVFDRASQTLKVLQEKKGNEIFLVPYSSIADTLQRMIFFKTAIASNQDAVLLFEEPEAHSFPPFISKITQEMIYNESNQYLIATHSPFIINDFLENARKDLSVFLVDYKRNETKVNRLSDEQLHEIFQSGVDLLTNNESFI